MIKYRRLTLADRYQIEALVQSKISLRKIAEILNVSAATISREISRNYNKQSYTAKKAQVLASQRRLSVGPPKKITGSLEQQVRKHIILGWSPEQISQRFKKISHETIYNYIYDDFKTNGTNLWSHLRRHRRWRKTHKASRSFKNIGKKTDCLWIKDRPQIVEERSRLGDIERDTMLGKRGGPALLVAVDRTSRLTRIRYLTKLNKEVTHRATLEIAKTLEVKTITNDNGGEFGSYQELAKKLEASIYFCRPFRSCERGTNEYTNGLLRQYFPKYEHPNPKIISKVERLLNNRPRKCLGFKTPLEVHNEMSAVALSS
jgi:transposase, IS30 family